MGESVVLKLVREVLHALGTRLAPYVETASPSTIKWSGIFGVAAFFVAVYTFRRGGRKPSPEAADLSDRDGPASSSSGASFHVTQAVQRASASSLQKSTSTPSTLSQRIRRRLKGVHKVTCSLSGVLFEEGAADALSTSATARPAAVEIIQALIGICDVYFITQVTDDRGEEKAHEALLKANLVGPEGVVAGKGILASHKSLYCTTHVGCTAIVRQLEPDLHIESSVEIVKELSRFVPRLLHVNASGAIVPDGAANISATTGLDAFFGTTA
ncbi:hypothetical protein CYMTET_31694 [Cymbomonas tetramitiformis]|uniref:Peroxisome biogenesis protein 22 n=1 Tax=Cymbomonas tetramitiformis TaxID=36881 RepID=A0AAE0FGS6_9CHLO|nr:hypothetical protein CYMTET_31694 [Cymbomonas tetramitiformis]